MSLFMAGTQRSSQGKGGFGLVETSADGQCVAPSINAHSGEAVSHHRDWGNLILGRVLPAFVFQIILVGKALASIRQFQVGVPASRGIPLLVWLPSQIFSVVFLALMVVLFVTRRPVHGKRSSFLGAMAALGGTFILYLPVAKSGDQAPAVLLVASSILLLIGIAWSVLSLAYLGRCFGLMPEARGLVTYGPYRWIRHPLYLGELAAALGLVLAAPSFSMLCVFLALCGLQYGRARLEERALLAAFPSYADYARHTWRILPGVH